MVVEVKVSIHVGALKAETAVYQLVGGIIAYQGYDG